MAKIGWLGVLGCLVSLTGCATFSPRLPQFGQSPEADTNAQFNAARMHEHDGHNDKAKQVYTELLATNPSHAAAHHRLGVMHVKQGDLEAGVRHLRQAQQINPADEELQTDLGYALFLQNNLDESARVLRDVVSRNAANKRAANNLGLVLARQGMAGESLNLFRQAGGEAAAHTNLAFVYSQMGDLDKAEAEFSKALDEDPELHSAAEGLVQLYELKQKRGGAEAQQLAGGPRATRDLASQRQGAATKAALIAKDAQRKQQAESRRAEAQVAQADAEYAPAASSATDRFQRTNIATAHFTQPNDGANSATGNAGGDVRLTSGQAPVPGRSPPQIPAPNLPRKANPLW